MIDTERQGADAARFNALVQNLGDLVTLHDAAGVILYATPSTARLLGYCEDELVGMNAFSLIHPDDLGVARLAFSRVLDVLNHGEPTEYRVHRCDGTWVDVETIGTNLLSDPAIGGIILTSRIITERKQHERQLEAITAVAAALRTAATRAELLPVILDQVIRVLAVDGAALFLRGTASDQRIVSLGRGRCDNWTGMGQRAGDDIVEQVIGTGQSFLSGDLHSDRAFSCGSQLRPEGQHVVAAACLPLKAREHTIGAVWVERHCAGRDSTCAITDEQMRLLNAIAEMSGNALHRATLAEQTERRLHRLMVLQAIDLTVSRSLDLQLSLDLLLGEITSRLHVDAADVFVMDLARNELRRVASRGFSTHFISRSDTGPGQELARRALIERRTIHIEGLTRQMLPPEILPVMEAEGFVSYYGLPLIASGRILGVLELFQRSSSTNDREWLDYLDGLAAHVAFAIEKIWLIEDLQRSNDELGRAYDGLIEGWSRALAARTRETPQESKRLIDMAMRFARLVGLDHADLTQYRRGAMLHDIGNMSLPDSILLQPGSLSSQEWDVVRTHPLHAYDLLSAIPDLREAVDIPFCHHERWDGSGYPRGLKGNQIPLVAQVFSIVDTYHALTSDRPFRKAWPPEKALELIRAEAGQGFNPEIVGMFLDKLSSIVVAGQ